MKLQLSQKEETEPAENNENTENLGNTIMFSEISISILAVENLQFNCATEQTLLKKVNITYVDEAKP